VLWNPPRKALLTGALTLLALLGTAASAGATITASQITSPVGPVYTIFDGTSPSTQTHLAVRGTTTGSGSVELVCDTAYDTTSLATLPVTANAFSGEVEVESLSQTPCVLRAVPVGEKELPPGSSTPFQGPVIAPAHFNFYETNGIDEDYDLTTNTLTGFLDFRSAGACGLSGTVLIPISFAQGAGPFECDAALYQSPWSSIHRSAVQVDGANAYGPAAAAAVEKALEKELGAKVSLAGTPQVTVTRIVESGIATIRESDPFVRCFPEPAVSPPTVKSCKEFLSTGAQLERTWQAGAANAIATMTDRWISTDAVSHSLEALYTQGLVGAETNPGTYRFPGSSKFSSTLTNERIPLPQGADTIYYKEDGATTSGGNEKNPQAAIVYDRSPSGQLTFFAGSLGNTYNVFDMPYQGTIPASGSYALRMAFVQAFALPEVEALAKEALAAFHPTLTIASPVNGSTVSSSRVTVSGTATDTGALASLAVGGVPVNLEADGSWSTSVTLSPGESTIPVTVTDQAGLSTSASASVTYLPPPPPIAPPPPAPVARASETGSASGADGKVAFTLTCAGTAGTSCEVQSLLTTIEKTRGGKPVAVAARHRPRTRSRQVTVGSSKLTIPAGQKLTIALHLNTLGRSLLARFGKLPVHLEAVLLGAGRSTIVAENLTVKPARKPKHEKHRH
jgi:hypothetical protein